MQYTVITGNPIDGFECYGVFDSESDAIEWANNDAHVPMEWHIMAINPKD